MIVGAVYHGTEPVQRIYHGGKIIFQIKPTEFHIIQDGKLIIAGAMSALPYPQGLYLDCVPDATWEYPQQNGNVLMLAQVFNAVPNENVLEVE